MFSQKIIAYSYLFIIFEYKSLLPFYKELKIADLEEDNMEY